MHGTSSSSLPLVEPMVAVPLPELPPLPMPIVAVGTPVVVRDVEACFGMKIVLSVTILQTAIVQTLFAVRQSTAAWMTAALNLTEACISIACLIALQRCDPGVIHRSPSACLPLPSVVATHLRAGTPLDGLSNIVDEDGGASYCVRCCVWRHAAKSAHHCSVCQHCVANFDHHCSFLGRCIAGSLSDWSGNMPYFKILLGMGHWSVPTTVGAIGAYLHAEWGWMAGAALAALYLLQYLIRSLTGCGVTCWLRWQHAHTNVHRGAYVGTSMASARGSGGCTECARSVTLSTPSSSTPRAVHEGYPEAQADAREPHPSEEVGEV